MIVKDFVLKAQNCLGWHICTGWWSCRSEWILHVCSQTYHTRCVTSAALGGAACS
jgi:hypothetical protein